MASSIKLCFFLLPLLFASLVIAQHAPKDPNYITDDGNDQCTVGASPPGATPPAPDNKDCPNKNKGQGGGDAAPKDGAIPPAPPADGQGGGGSPNKDCPNKNKGQGGGDAAPKDGAIPPAPPADGQGGGASPNKDCPLKKKDGGGAPDGAIPPAPPADGQGGGKDCPLKKKDGGGAPDGAIPPAPPADGQGGGAAPNNDCPLKKKDGGGAPDGAIPPAPPADGQGGGASPNKDCPLKKKDGGGAPDGAIPPAPPADGQGGGKDCPLKKKDGGGAPDGAIPPAPPADGQGGGASPNKDCPNKNKGQGGGDAAPKDGAIPPAPPADGQGGGASPNKDCPNKNKGQGGGDAAPKDGAIPPAPPADGQGGGASPNKDCPNKNKGQGGGDAAPKDGAIPPAPPADGQGGGASPNKDCPNKNKGQGGGDAAPKDGAIPPAPPADGQGGGASPNKDCPNKNKGQGGGDAAPKDGAIPPAPPADGQGGGASPNKDCPNKNKGQGGGDAAPKDRAIPPAPPADGQGGGASPNKDCPLNKKDGGGAPADGQGGQGGNKDCPLKNKGQGGDKKDGAIPPAKAFAYGNNDVKASFFAPPLYKQAPLEPKFNGEWKIDNPNVGVSAMQYQLMPNNRAVWFDTTNLGPSALELGPKGNCPPNPDTNNEPDCFAHALSYDIDSGVAKPVYIRTDPWCSSGNLLPNGDLMSTGGNKMGFRSIRIIKATDAEPKFVEKENALGANRWYASNCVLEDGGVVVVGGRDAFSYDYVPPNDGKIQLFDFPFLQQTCDPPAGQGLYVENNLYPFIYLLPDGNVFIFANDRAVAFEPKTGKVVKEYPQLTGSSRNYPASGMSALMPLRLTPKLDQPINVEVVVCGGNRHDAINQVDKRYTQNRVFTPANADCNRIKPMADKPVWDKEQDMPTPRTMGDLLQLPNAQFLLINGAKKGCSGWEDGEDPNLTPTLYMPENEMGKRFKELTPTTIPRMYHSVSSVIPDGHILVAGSNAHQFYTYDGPYYPTELRVEKFRPPYLDPALDNNRPAINPKGTDVVLKYGQPFKVVFTLASNQQVAVGDVIVTMLYPPFTTHGWSQCQRMIIVGIEGVDKNTISAVAPPSGTIAPPGYYMMFVNHRSVPGEGIWVHLD